MKTKVLPTPMDFRTFLQNELLERCRKNKSYSLRSFAKHLNLSSSALAEMLNGKRTITTKSIEKVGTVLGLNLDEVNQFILSHKKTTKVSRKEGNTNKYRAITIDQYALISDWYHYAIIELLKVNNFQSDNTWIAKTLSITKSEVNFAIERLLRLGLIEKDKKGNLKDTSSGFSTNISPNLTSSGSKKLQKQVLEQSINALMSLPIEVRNHSSMTMAIDPKHMPEAIQMLTQFRRKLCDFLESKGNPTDVYQLSLSLFPITNQDKFITTGENK